MITRHILRAHPSANMHVLKVLLTHLPRRPRASIHMIQLLLARSESVSIPLVLRNLGHNVQILKPRNFDEAAQGLNHSELVEITSGDNGGVLVLLENLGDESTGHFGLAGAFFDAVVDGRAGVAFQRGGAAFAGPVVVDCKEGAAAVDHFPVRGEGFARVGESLAVVDAAGVEAQRRAGEDFVPVSGAARGAFHETDDARVVEVGCLDVAAGCAAVLVVDGVDVDPEVVNVGEAADFLSQGGEGQICVGDAVVGCAGAVLDFLQEHDGGSVEIVNDVLGDVGQVGAVRFEVLDVVGAEGQAVAFAVGGDGRWGRESVDRALDLGAGLREDGVEAKDICDDAGDVFELVTELGSVRVAAAIERCTDDNGFGVGVAVGDGEATLGVLSRYLPVATDLCLSV